MKNIFLSVIMIIVMALTGCNTFKGMGKGILRAPVMAFRRLRIRPRRQSRSRQTRRSERWASTI